MKRTPLPTALTAAILLKLCRLSVLTMFDINLLGMDVFDETFMDLMFLNYVGLSLDVLLMWQVPLRGLPGMLLKCAPSFLRVILTR